MRTPLTPEEVHANTHATLAEWVKVARKAKDKKRKGGDAAWLLRSHLSSSHGGHGMRGSMPGPWATLAQLHELHVAKHAEA